MIAYRINDQVLLAGQPAPEDWQRLAAEGYQTVINMRSDPERAARQAEAAAAAGLRYLHLPLPTYEIEPEQIDVFRAAIAQAGAARLVVHCRTANRVALLWMLNRMVGAGWSAEQAEAELQAAGYDADALENYRYCAEDYFERCGDATLASATLTTPTTPEE